MAADALMHEEVYRGEQVMRRLADLRVAICGAGALGGNMAESLARQGARRLLIIDRDRVDRHNLSTQPYDEGDVGHLKARALAFRIYRAVKVECGRQEAELTPANVARLLEGAGLIVDAFDNHAGRQAITDHATRSGAPCLHVGLARMGGYGEAVWNERYRVPNDPEPGDLDACEYPLARNLVMLTVAAACEEVVRFAAAGERISRSVTLGDLTISRI